MTERGARRGAGAPFYAPPRRKTSAEIISEARAAIYGEMSGPSGGGTGGGGLRPLRTRRPYTPREPQRALYNERTRKKDARPPSGFDTMKDVVTMVKTNTGDRLKFLSVSEGNEETLAAMEARIANFDDDELDQFLAEAHDTKSKPQPRQASRPTQSQGAGDRATDSWSGFTKLPHLSGRSKPLHRRNNASHSIEESKEAGLERAISITRPLSEPDRDSIENTAHVNTLDRKSSSSDGNVKHKQQYSGSRTSSSNATAGSVSDISVKHIAVQLPNTNEHYDNMTVLELSEALSQKSRDSHRTLQLLEALICKMQTNLPGTSLRGLVMQALYKHIDSEDESIQVAVARAMLTMRVIGPHLTVACKLVFKIAKNDKNDHFFIDTNLLELLVEGCGRLEPVSECECVVWGAAALRVLALEPRLAARAHTAGAAHLAALHLKLLNAAKAERPLCDSEQSTHAVFQVTGALRSLASDEHHAPHFLQSGALPELVAALALHTDRDVLTNVARCLSVVSGWGACAAALCAGGAVRAGVRALAACAPRAPLAVRLAYTLGNLAAAHPRARNDIYDEDGAIDVLLMILETYTKRSIQGSRETDVEGDQHLIDTDLGGSDGSDEDVLIKTVRVIANLCLTERAGRGLAANYAERTVKALLGCLQVAEKITKDESKSGEERTSTIERGEELATAALATLNNITYYSEPPEPPDPLQLPFDEICKGVCSWVRYGGSCGCEAVRALGNVSRTARAAQLLLLHDALLHLHRYLDHEDAGVRCAAAGVLVNVCGCAGGAREGGRRAARALCAAARRHDAAPAPLLARALWNALAHPHVVLEHALARDVTHALATFIDDDSVFAACEAVKLGDIEVEPELSKYQVTFDSDNNNYTAECSSSYSHKQGDGGVSEEDGDVTGEDLGFEEGEAEECACTPCRRLAAWDELVAVAIPLMEKLRPTRSDAAVGTD